MRFLLVFRRENYVAFCAASKNALFEKKVTKLYFKIYLVFLFAIFSMDAFKRFFRSLPIHKIISIPNKLQKLWNIQ